MQENIEKEYTSKFDWSLWLKMLHQLKGHKSKVLLLTLVMVFNALIDTTLPLMTKYGIDNMIIPKDYSGIQTFSLMYILLILFQFVNVYLLIDLAGRIETGLNFDLRSKAFRKLQGMSFSYFDRTSSGWIVARVTSDINRLGDVVAWGIVDLIWGFAMIIFVLGVVFSLSWKLALILLALMPVIAIISIYFQEKMFRLFRQVRRYNSMITHSFGEGIHGAKTTKTLVCEDANLDEFMGLSQKMYGSSIKSAIISALFMPMVLMISSLGTGLVVWIGGASVLGQVISYGTLVAFISYTMHLFEPFSNVARLFAEMQHAQASAERVFSLINLEPEITSSEDYTQAWKEKPMQGKISLKDMSFAYKETHPVFQNFNLEIAPGESVALVGETGTGKTTLVNLICRFYEPQQGLIEIDDIDYRKLPLKWIHSNLGYVQQVPHLFQGSVMENIRYGRLNASDEEVMEAARLVCADEFIQNLPDTYDYKVGEAGNLLSTGQKQLIAFARVVLADPALLILDEATASIDTETEQLVQEAMHVVLKGRTGIIVAHRLSTIRQVDRILLLHKGEILEMGNHHDLMHKKGRYYQLYMNQFMQEVAEEELQKEA
ncbi:MAG: ABC transporter ATP-binding protein [Candidatus Cloacimonadaceae bacterium]|jgi:ATP-binding cassette subfamily B protein|nr:ABC transporter ATP-binding protein/permease [Candidatus Cloacimonadota bacterium]MCK9334557.1 ABC transporter ATP-binding protein/permease [Candidatus Cloacimonadota bacterium]MDD4035197.1 ABC transporter ATP-binding protein [Candidatus Cloacimonadota bacterium]MDD4668029.1 ABC transporter ATP-binding protein [Candidatus Cloacimonadota bacterium]MDY0337739.1 ABC transporter ATP-binding protein [Candidatus Cloacimonadaceae bacterium]